MYLQLLNMIQLLVAFHFAQQIMENQNQNICQNQNMYYVLFFPQVKAFVIRAIVVFFR